MKRWLRLLALLISLAFSVALMWYAYRDNGEHSVLLTGVLFALLYGLIATGVIELPQGSNIPFFTLWPRASDAMKALVSFLLIFLWTPIAMQLTPDTPVGAPIILVPDLIFLLAALVYLSNGLSRNVQ